MIYSSTSLKKPKPGGKMKGYGIVSQTWIIECLKMYKIPNKIINFISEGKLEIMRRNSCSVKIQRSNFQGDLLSVQLFVIAMIPFNKLGNARWRGGLQIYKITGKDWSLYVYGRHQAVYKNWKRTGDPDTNKNIEPEYGNYIWHRKMCHAHNEKWEKGSRRRNRTTKSGKY